MNLKIITILSFLLAATSAVAQPWSNRQSNDGPRTESNEASRIQSNDAARTESNEASRTISEPQTVPLASSQAMRGRNGHESRGGAELQPITVTTQGYRQEWTEVPIGSNTFGLEEIEAHRIRRLEDAFMAVPSISLTSQRGGNDASNLSIRGVSNTAFGTDSAVAMYLDDVYMGSDNSFNMRISDLEQIEILRGPQGTLYGRNSLGGAVNIRTADPKIGESFGLVESTYGTKQLMRGALTHNLGINDRTALRASLYADRGHGWIANQAGGDRFGNSDSQGVRVKVLFQPEANWRVTVSADYNKDSGRKAAFGPIATVWSDGIAQINPFLDGVENYGLSVRSAWKRKRVELKYTAGWRGMSSTGFGGNYTLNPNPSSGFSRGYDQLTQELQGVGETGRFRWTAGAFLFWSKEGRYESAGLFQGLPAASYFDDQPQLPPMFQEGSTSDQETISSALYGDVTWRATERLDVVTGARVSYDSKSIKYRHESNVDGFTLYAPQARFDDRMRDEIFMPRVGVSFAANSDLRLYGLISRGAKTGGYNISFVSNDRYTYQGEAGTNYEVGVKGEALSGRVRLAASMFYFDWSNQQYYRFDIPTNGMVALNAPESRSYGLEGSIGYRADNGLSIWAGAGYQDARFSDVGQASDSGIVNGNWQPLTSRVSANVSVSYERPLWEGVRMTSTAQVAYRSPFYWDVANTLRADGYGLLNVSTGIESSKGWRFTLFVDNVFDQEHFLRAETYAAGVYAVPGRPRTIGVTGRLAF